MLQNDFEEEEEEEEIQWLNLWFFQRFGGTYPKLQIFANVQFMVCYIVISSVSHLLNYTSTSMNGDAFNFHSIAVTRVNVLNFDVVSLTE